MEIITLHTLDTEYSADSIEWCPHPDFLSYFACGTYQLEGNNEESTSPPCRRKGRIYLYKFDAKITQLTELYRVETAAILDMKWLFRSNFDNPVLATANAMGQIEVFILENDQLTSKCNIDLNPEYHNLLALSLDWDWPADAVQQPNPNENHKILSSDSKGDIHILKYGNCGGDLEKVHSWSAHSFEAWICCFDKWDENRIFTGGDDSFLHAFDIRTYEKTFTNETHIAGVTCLLSHPVHSNLLLTGSYDERLRIFDTRNMKKPLNEINLNGGIWRLKVDPLNKNLILAACMYKNFSIVKLSCDNFSNVNLVGEYNEHESICYGADWCLNTNENDENDQLYMATCSFYDHKLCISRVVQEFNEDN